MINVHKKLKKLLETFTKSPSRVFTIGTLDSKEKELQELVDLVLQTEAKNVVEEALKKDSINFINQIRRKLRDQKEYLNNDCRDVVLFRVLKKKMSFTVPPPPFFKEQDDFEIFLSSVENYMKLIKTEDATKTNLLLYLLGKSASKVIDYLKPKDITKATYTELVAACSATFSSDNSEAYIKFFSKNQMDEKSVDYALHMKTLAQKAKINDEKILVNRIIPGLKNDTMKFELLKSKILTFDVLLQQIAFLETVCKISSNEAVVNHSKFKKNYKKNSFGNKSHKKDKNTKDHDKNNRKKSDENKNFTCNYCKKPGHIKRNCYKLKNKNKTSNELEFEASKSLGSLRLE